MATKIKLQRIGARKKAYYRIVVSESTQATSSGPIEFLGTYDPHKDPPEIKIDLNRVDHWTKNGALPTPKVTVLIRKARTQAANSAV